MISLRARLILAASVILSLFLVVAGYALQTAFYKSAEQSLRENLHGYLNLLLASADFDPQGEIDMPARLLDTKFSLPSSGLYGIIIDATGKPLWKSLSTVGINLPTPQILPAGETHLHTLMYDEEEYMVLSYGVDWYTASDKRPLTFNIITELRPFKTQVYTFRRTLGLWLVGLALALLVTQVAILIWGLRPLHNVRQELLAIDGGKQTRIAGRYPSELRLLTQTINELIDHQHAQQTRYRHALADLAHSLKTPLAVLRGAIAELPASILNKNTLDDQVQRMDHIVAHQLQRAATAGSTAVRQSIALAPLVDKLFAAMAKVYRDKNIRFENTLPDPCRVRVDAGDAMEVLGNLIDNASKWCRQQVRVQAQRQTSSWSICVEDDGPGIAAEQVALILQRGGRIDEAMPGQGIGLAVAHEIISNYASKLQIERSPLGGAAFWLALPLAE
ncbi:MAG: two-component sensor histidine kinase [Gammaproteobacteria bacterium]|nr:two-component sensor histidine kinase [Gammaproteobacteria bacterium]